MRTVPLILSALLLAHTHVLRADELVNSFQDSVVFTNVGYASGSTVISNFPLRVDISTSRPGGFVYDLAGDKAATLRFNYHDEYEDASTNAVLDTMVYYSITNWNPEGESTLYVNLPRFSNSPKAKLTMYWNPVDYAEIPPNLSITVPPAVSNEAQSAEWNQAIVDQSTNANYIACGPAYRFVQHGGARAKKLLNYWLTEPTISKKSWKQGEDPATIDVGLAMSSSECTVTYILRSDNSNLGTTMPVVPGSYRAVVTAAESETYAPISSSLDFDITSGAKISGMAAVDSFANRATFSLTDNVKDTSSAATFMAGDAGQTAAQSTYNYKAEIDGSGEVTIGIWFKFDSTLPHVYNQSRGQTALISLCSYGQQQNGPLSIVLNNYKMTGTTLNRNEIRAYGCVGTWKKDGNVYSAGADLLTMTDHAWGDDKWHFAMASRTKSGKVQLYVDGQYMTTQLEPVAGKIYSIDTFYIGDAGNLLSLGCDPYYPKDKNMGFNGWLAEAQVYNRELSQAEMDALYASRSPERRSGDEDGLIAYFPMNEGTGATLSDRNKSSCGMHSISAGGTLFWQEGTGLPFKAGMEELHGKPFLVRISDNSPKGFYYDNLPFGKTLEDFYSDVRFFDGAGRALNYVVETWDPTGESHIWVGVKKISANTKVIMCWGQGGGTDLTENDPDSVWNPTVSEEERNKHRNYYLDNYDQMIQVGEVVEDSTKCLQNRWLVEPSLSFTQWKPGDESPDVRCGASYSGVPSVAYYNRSTGERLESMPSSVIGEYRAVFRCEETAKWSELEKVVDFRIVRENTTHELGEAQTRILLANNDWSISGGEVYSQSYDDNESGWGVPYWTHHENGSTEDVSDFDSTKLSSSFNLFAGTCHEYISGTDRIWGLVNVRFGNLFNNGRFNPGEEGTTGLHPEQNYLPWNPRSERMLSSDGMTVGGYHRYAGTFLLQNVRDELSKDYAQICSQCYDDGIGTIYFDVVNAFTNNVRDADGNANYAIVVEVATNVSERIGTAPVDAPWPEGIWSVDSATGELIDPYRYADWHAVEMTPIRFRGDTGSADDYVVLPATRELELDITDGGTACNFYRVYVPVNANGQARFRIRRTRIDESASLNPDADAYIIVDNLICSRARDIYQLIPYGWCDPDKYGKQYLGQEAAFIPPFPGPRDAVTARVRAVDSAGRDVDPGKITAVTMHYRWHYLGQQCSKWMYADFDPMTLTALQPLILPGFPGDVDFWFEGSQNGGYYTYANYSGTKIGVPGYSESFALITNGWNGVSAEYGIRIREGSSDWESGVLIVREPNKADREIQMELDDNHQWRAYYQTTNAIAEGVQVRFELRNRQESGSKTWSWNTNCYYCAEHNGDLEDELPFCGKIASGTTNNWTHVPVDHSTGYIMFQVDDSSLGLTVVRADYQNFNYWTDGHGDVFVGSSADDSTLPASGASPLSREFTRYYNKNQDEVTPSTNGLWTLDFKSRNDYTYYKYFPASTEVVNGWLLGKGRYVYGNYAMSESGTAFEMYGQSEGYVEFSDQSLNNWPRGIEKVTFNARLAQKVSFEDFSYVVDCYKKTDYDFAVHAAFDHNDNKDFTGNASLSMIGYYRDGVGCYEARWEFVKGKTDTPGIITGPDSYGLRLTLYRWNRSGNGYVQTMLGTWDNWNTFRISAPTASKAQSLMDMAMQVMSLTVYGTGGNTMVVVGLCKAGKKAATFPVTDWVYAAYQDNSAQKLTGGSYGVLSANCPAYFLCPMISSSTVTGKTWGNLTLPEAGKSSYTTQEGTYPLSMGNFTPCKDDIINGYWVTVPGRSEIVNEGKSCYGFKSADVVQTVDLVAANSKGEYKEVLKTFTISNAWGKVNRKIGEVDFGADIPLVWRTPDTKLRLRTGGELGDESSPAVVIDDITVHQWRGMNEIVLYTGENPDRKSQGCKEVKNGDPDNFVYTGGWVVDRGNGATTMEFSARRTLPGRPAGVRTPLMDGLDGRGSGIGNICFSYRDAQPNVALLVQIATNVYRGDLASLTAEEGTNTSWRTWCRLTYDDLGTSGTTNISFAIRNAGGAGFGSVARVIIDPDLVSSVTSISNVEEFGSIHIDYVTCQDEPPINKGCWWGWNVRTLGDDGDPEGRMYLPDGSHIREPGYSMALNNSVTEDIVEAKAAEYPRHMPFLQSPSFTNDNVIGQVSFRARKYGYSDQDQAAEIALYGITADKLSSDEWTLLTRFVVSNTVFTAYSYRVDLDAGYCAVRLAVTGVKGVNAAERGPAPLYGDDPVRVLLDEVVISEAVFPQLSFRDVGAFRSDMSGSGVVPNVPSREEQPLCAEGWGVQCELYAVMLADEIDKSSPPRVKLYWYEGEDVWGYENWKDLPSARSAWLGRATDSDLLIYRSSYDTAPDAVIPQSTKEPGVTPVVQYMLEAFYTVVDPKTGVKTETRKLLDVEGGEWTVPAWYSPVDYNTDPGFGNREDWSCFCILDDLAPGWAWINEVNIFNDPNKDWDNDDVNCQFIEIAAPQEFDLSGWRIELIEPREYDDKILTNVVAVFGRDGLSPTKNVNITSNYAFYVVANRDKYTGDRSVLEREGALDGYWRFDNPTWLFDKNGVIDWGDSFAIRLVRSNGIVEHEIVTVGTNIYTSALNAQYMPTGVVAYLNREMKPANFFYPGEDCNNGDHSVGVVNGQGEKENPLYSDTWNNTMRRTPGTINEGQQINPDYPVPNGEMMAIYLNLDQSGGPIWHSFDGGVSFTNEAKRIFLKNGSILGTNIVYQVEPWYEMEYVKQIMGDEVKYFDVSNGFDRVNHTVEVTVGRLCTNRITVVAKATPDHQIKDLGCDENNVYRPAVIDWLQKGETLHGPFVNNDGVLRAAEFWGLYSTSKDRDLTITEMYWLDIDPTAGEMMLKAGMCKPPMEVLVPIYDEYDAPAFVTNLTMSVFMMISNRTQNAESALYGQAWSPYVLRGVQPGDISHNYTAGSGLAWTSETFKISGLLPNGHTTETNRNNWVDLRWFIFMPDSFYQPSDEPDHARFTTDIEIIDPLNRPESPGYGVGWHDWVFDPEHPERWSVRPFFRWALDTRLRPFEVEILKKENYLRPTP